MTFSPRQELRSLQQRAQDRDAIKQFDIENMNAATLVQVRIRTSKVGAAVTSLLESDAVMLQNMQPTEEINIKFDVNCTKEIETLEDILED